MKKYLLFIFLGILGLILILSLYYFLIRPHIGDSNNQIFKNKIGGTPSEISFSKEDRVYVTDGGYPQGNTIESRFTGFAIWEADSALKTITPYSLDARPIQVIENSDKIFINNGSEANGKFIVMDNTTKKIDKTFELKYTGVSPYSFPYFSNFFEYNDQLFLVAGDVSNNSIPTFIYNKKNQKLEQTEIKTENQSFFAIKYIGILKNKVYFFATDSTELRSRHLVLVDLETKKITNDFNLGDKALKGEVSVFDTEKNIIYVPTISYNGENNKEVSGSLLSINTINGEMNELKLPNEITEISEMDFVKNRLVFSKQDILSGTIYVYDTSTQQVVKKFKVGDSIANMKASPDQSKLYVLTNIVKLGDSYPRIATDPKLKVFVTTNFQKTGEINVTQK